MKKTETYLSLCTQVYDLSKPTPPEDAYSFYRFYVLKAKGLVLEPMCGTGRFLLPLIEEGFDIHGFDVSEHMLEALHAKSKLKNLKPNVWKGFVEDLKKKERYSLIFIPSGSFCLVIDPVAVKSVLKTFYDHLAEDGILLFEGETPKATPPLGVWRHSKWVRSDGKMIMLSQHTALEDEVYFSICKYELIDNNHVIHREIEELKEIIENK